MLLLETIDILIQTNDKQQDECPYDLKRLRSQGRITPFNLFSHDLRKIFAPRIAKKLNGFAVQTDYDAAAEGGKVRTGWNERPQLIGHIPGDSFALPFKGSAVAIQVIADRKPASSSTASMAPIGWNRICLLQRTASNCT